MQNIKNKNKNYNKKPNETTRIASINSTREPKVSNQIQKKERYSQKGN